MRKDDSESFIHTKRKVVQYRNHSILVVAWSKQERVCFQAYQVALWYSLQVQW
jgi:hypothetical protein